MCNEIDKFKATAVCVNFIDMYVACVYKLYSTSIRTCNVFAHEQQFVCIMYVPVMRHAVHKDYLVMHSHLTHMCTSHALKAMTRVKLMSGFSRVIKKHTWSSLLPVHFKI